MSEQSEKYTQIENDILERLFSHPITINQYQVFLYISRKTKGFHKEVDYITNQQISDGTKLCKSVVSRVLNDLETMQIITRKGKILGIQNDISKWQKLAVELTNEKLAVELTELAVESTIVSSRANSLPPNTPISSTKETSTKETIQKKDSFLLPDFISKKIWEAFKETRKKLRAPLTDTARGLIVKDLERIRGETGNDPNEVLNQSIMRGWRGVFPLKNGGNHEQRYGSNAGGGKSQGVRTTEFSDEEYRRPIGG